MTISSKKRPNPLLSPELVQGLISESEGQSLFGKEGFFQKLKEELVNGILEGELTHHLGYVKNDKEPKENSNRRNGHYEKKVLSDGKSLCLQMPRDREGVFDSQLIGKGVRRFDGFDDKVISLYARGMTIREIQGHLYDLYGTEVSPELISNVTEKVLEDVTAWQNRPLDSIYPIVYLDCIHVKTRDDHVVLNKAVYIALGVNMEGKKEVLGIWMSQNEGAKFWMQVMTELQNRGVKDIFIACVDGLKGFEEAIHAIYPKTTVQLCIVHIVRNSLKFVSWKDKKAVAADLKTIYNSSSEKEARGVLANFRKKWDPKYGTIGDIWERNWEGIAPCFAFPKEIKKAVYTTNAIEAINRQIRKIIKNKGVFPNDQAVQKCLFLALNNAQKKWTMPIRNWPLALNQFALLFEGRVKF